jgi:CBS domain-containing protein
MVRYKIVEVFANQRTKWQGRPIDQAMVEYVRSLKIAARCMVARGTEGSYEGGEIATGRIEILSYNLPLRITVILPESSLDAVLPKFEEMVSDGVVAISDVHIVSYKARKLLLPRQVQVRDIMTPDPVTVSRMTPLDQVVRILLTSIFTGVPVVEDGRPVGVITQGDLVYKGKMPVRLGLLAEAGSARLETALVELSSKKAEDVMTSPVVTIGLDRYVREAINLMVEKELKRLPVVDERRALVGMLSRLDVFRAIMKEAPDWKSFGKQDVQIGSLKAVSDIMRRDTHTVLPTAPIEDVLRIIDTNDIQRVAVVDSGGKFLGLIADRDLLLAFAAEHPEGIWEQLKSMVPLSDRAKRNKDFKEKLKLRTASEMMNSKVTTVQEDTPIDDAISLMTEKAFKRLPVVDEAGMFKGMISRDSLLRTGFNQGKPA